jgi:hypothetical protein
MEFGETDSSALKPPRSDKGGTDGPKPDCWRKIPLTLKMPEQGILSAIASLENFA